LDDFNHRPNTTYVYYTAGPNVYVNVLDNKAYEIRIDKYKTYFRSPSW